MASPFSPLIEELLPAPRVDIAFRRMARLPCCVFFDSALRHETLGRYSFLAADPFAFLRVPADGSDGLARLAELLAPFTAPTIEGLPPFQGGAAGLFAYDLARSLERVPAPRFDEFGVPALAVGLYDVVVAFDHAADRAWIVSQGFPEVTPAARRERAEARLAEVRGWLADGESEERESRAGGWGFGDQKQGDRVQGSGFRTSEENSNVVRIEQLAPQFEIPGRPGLTSNFSADAYRAAVQQVIDYILAGDVFQVNLAQRLLHPAADGSVSLYLRLRERNPATFAGYFDLGDFQICSASPERFLQVRDRQVEARPIKGTRARTSQPEADMYRARDLTQSEKDRAENVMIVDLMRNDLSRVCRADSVRVTQLCGLESYAFVQHLVSVVRGTLQSDKTPLELLAGCFPGGSITGAPKVRAMEIIAELEPTARGAYCGSLGYLGFDGAMDTSILIRMITAGRGWWQLPVGGGIVAASEPVDEYQETWDKAEGLLRALGGK